jgi:tetratricopeptide (TPR) repeat protein
MRLVDQSLVNVQVEDGRTRYRFLETVRYYAAERLETSDESAVVRGRYRDWCVDVVERAGKGLEGPDQFACLRLLTMEHANIRAVLEACALDASLSETELRLVAAMARFWFSRQPDEGRRRLAAALARAVVTASPARVAALTWRAVFELELGDPALGRDLVSQAVTEARAAGDSRLAARALRVLTLTMDDSHTADRVTLLEEALALSRAAGDAGQVAVHLAWLAAAVANAGDLQRARALAEESDRFGQTSGDTWRRVVPSIQLGWLAVAEDRLDEAELCFRTAVDLGTGWGSFYSAFGMFGLGHVSLRRGETEHARKFYRQALLDFRETSSGSVTPVYLVEGLACAASLAACRGLHERAHRLMGAYEAWHDARGVAGRTWLLSSPRSLVRFPPMPSDPVLARARVEGRGLTLDEAVACALEPA